MESLRVLIVDDEDLVRQMLTRLLQRNHIDSAHAGSVTEAIALLDAGGFDIVITDQNMPGGQGTELLTYLTMKSPGTATIMISGERDPILDDVTRHLGGVAFLAKPFEEEALMSLIHTLHQEKRSRTSGPEEG